MAFQLIGDRVARLLLIEDDVGARAALGDILSYEGYPTALCANGLEALDYLHTQPLPSLIILGLQMPVMNGWQFCHECKKDIVLASVPVVVITAFQSPGDLEVDEVMKKPIDLDHLLDTVRHYC